MKKYSKGFTLIELLVVIAIIGILSSVVLASLSTARNKGRDASAKASISSIRNSMEMYFIGTGANTYGSVSAAVAITSSGAGSTPANACGTDPDVIRLAKAAAAQIGGTVNCTVGLSGATYVVDATLNDSTIFCVDSTGFSGKPSGVVKVTGAAVSCTP